MKILYTLIALTLSIGGFSQTSHPTSNELGVNPSWNIDNTMKAPGDSCGIYYNNYVGLNKTSSIYYEDLRSGSGTNFNPYGGRAQHFHAYKPIEISGIQFYAFETNPTVDSLMAITILHDYDAINDTVGVELARDTIYVKHQAFTVNLPNIEVNSVFDSPVTVTSDYMISVYTPTDDSLKIIVSSAFANDGAGEGVSYLIYNNPSAGGLPFAGYYNTFAAWGVTYDLDYLINPRVKYDLNDSFTLLDDSICPGVISGGCVAYNQDTIYTDPHYNGFSATATSHILWLWGDGFQNTNLLTACHTYPNQGAYTISLNDTLVRHDFNSSTCIGQASEIITVIDSVIANFTFVTGGIIVDFTSTSTSTDSVSWDFGDGTFGGDSLTIQHNFDSLNTFDVWLYAYNECDIDSVMIQVTTDDVGIKDNTINFKVYPNPAENMVTIAGLHEGSKVEIINILGETIYTTIASNNKETLNVDQLSNGTYFVRVSNESDQITKKLIVRH